MNKELNFLLLIISIICFSIVSICLFVMFFIETSVSSPPSRLSLLCGIGFWLCNILGMTIQIVISRNIKCWCQRRRLFRTRFKKERIGIFNIFSNIPATISDVLFAVSTILFIAFMIIDSTSIFAYISLSLLFLSFSAHCIFNGNNYYYITNYEFIKAQLMKMEDK